jgi:hypothetical protein
MTDTAAAIAELDVGAALDSALVERGLDVMHIEAAEYLSGISRLRRYCAKNK